MINVQLSIRGAPPALVMPRHAHIATDSCSVRKWKRLCAGGSRSAFVVGLADMVLGIELDAELGVQVELGLEIVDVLFLVAHHLLEQAASDVLLDGMTMHPGLRAAAARRDPGRPGAVELFP